MCYVDVPTRTKVLNFARPGDYACSDCDVVFPTAASRAKHFCRQRQARRRAVAQALAACGSVKPTTKPWSGCFELVTAEPVAIANEDACSDRDEHIGSTSSTSTSDGLTTTTTCSLQPMMLPSSPSLVPRSIDVGSPLHRPLKTSRDDPAPLALAVAATTSPKRSLAQSPLLSDSDSVCDTVKSMSPPATQPCESSIDDMDTDSTDDLLSASSSSKMHDDGKLCHNCGKRFTRRSNRDRHMATVHGGCRPYSCAHPGCTKSFGQKATLKRHHGRKHIGVVAMSCAFCRALIANGEVSAMSDPSNRLSSSDTHSQTSSPTSTSLRRQRSSRRSAQSRHLCISSTAIAASPRTPSAPTPIELDRLQVPPPASSTKREASPATLSTTLSPPCLPLPCQPSSPAPDSLDLLTASVPVDPLSPDLPSAVAVSRTHDLLFDPVSDSDFDVYLHPASPFTSDSSEFSDCDDSYDGLSMYPYASPWSESSSLSLSDSEPDPDDD